MTALRLRRHRRRAAGKMLALLATAVCLVASLGFSGAGASPPTGPVLTWSTVSSASAPPPLANASAVYDSDNATIVLFGGSETNGALSNDTWVWNGSSWTEFPATQTGAPPARQMASMAFDPDLHQLILFGGLGADGVLGDTWAWNGASWYKESGLTSPPPREAAAMAYDGSRLVLFGGTGDAPGLPSDSPTTSNSVPAPSAPAASSTTGSTAAVPVALDDTWVWTGTGWAESTATGPSARSEAALSYDSAKHQTVLFGGETTPVGSKSLSLVGDTWIWNGSAWKRATPHTSPTPRAGAAVADDPYADGVVLTGGEVGAQQAAVDTWGWNGSNWLITTAGAPSARDGAAAAYDRSSKQVILFGGTSPGGQVLGDTNVLTSSQSGPGAGSAPTSAAGSTSPTTSATPATGPPGNGSSYTPAGTQSAQSGPRSGAHGSAPPRSTTTVVHRSEKVTLSGSGFKPGTSIQITFHSAVQTVGYTTADDFGYFHDTVSVPGTAAEGSHHFEAAGTGNLGQPTQLAFAVKVVGVPGQPRPTTSQTLIMVGIAFLIPLAAWVILSQSDGMRGRARRRHRAEQPAQ